MKEKCDSFESVKAAYISQLEAEDRLIAQRMGWMLQFNGFLIAAYGIALRYGASIEAAEKFLQSVPWIGLGIAGLGLLGIFASMSAAGSKRREWVEWSSKKTDADQLISSDIPTFQSGPFAWYAGIINGIGVPLVMLGFWIWIVI